MVGLDESRADRGELAEFLLRIDRRASERWRRDDH